MEQKVDGIAIGNKLREKMVDNWLEALVVCFELAGDKEALKEFSVAFGRNPKHIIKAAERFPLLFDPNNKADLYDILAAIHLSKIKSDDDAHDLFNNTFVKYKSYEMLKNKVDELTKRKPRAKKQEQSDTAMKVAKVIAKSFEWSATQLRAELELIEEVGKAYTVLSEQSEAEK